VEILTCISAGTSAKVPRIKAKLLRAAGDTFLLLGVLLLVCLAFVQLERARLPPTEIAVSGTMGSPALDGPSWWGKSEMVFAARRRRPDGDVPVLNHLLSANMLKGSKAGGCRWAWARCHGGDGYVAGCGHAPALRKDP